MRQPTRSLGSRLLILSCLLLGVSVTVLIGADATSSGFESLEKSGDPAGGGRIPLPSLVRGAGGVLRSKKYALLIMTPFTEAIRRHDEELQRRRGKASSAPWAGMIADEDPEAPGNNGSADSAYFSLYKLLMGLPQHPGGGDRR